MSSFGQISCSVEVATELRKAARMIRVLVRNENGVEAFGISINGGEAAKSFFASESSFEEKGSTIGFEQRGIARAAGS